MKSLVIFYSLTGKTKLVSQTIAEALNAELMEIEEVKPRRRGFVTYLTGGFAALTNKGSQIRPVNVNWNQYDMVFIGSPVWASRPPPAINSLVYANNLKSKNIVPFFTMGGDNSDKALENITAKIERNQGKVISSFAIKSYSTHLPTFVPYRIQPPLPKYMKKLD
jgi:flavodoxin